MKQDNIFRVEKFTIDTHGKPLTTVRIQNKKSDHAGLNQVSFETIMELFKCLELSQHQNKKISTLFLQL